MYHWQRGKLRHSCGWETSGGRDCGRARKPQLPRRAQPEDCGFLLLVTVVTVQALSIVGILGMGSKLPSLSPTTLQLIPRSHVFALETLSLVWAHQARVSWDPRGVPRVKLPPHAFRQVLRGHKLPAFGLKNSGDFTFPSPCVDVQIKVFTVKLNPIFSPSEPKITACIC